MNAAVMCGAGFKAMEEAEKTFAEVCMYHVDCQTSSLAAYYLAPLYDLNQLDVDGDGNITLEEFKGFLKQV